MTELSCKFYLKILMNTLEVKQLTKRFDKKEVLRGVSFGVKKGQLLALLGTSGCGKTTTLRMIAGLENPDAGEIWIAGAIASQGSKAMISLKQRHIGMVFQDLALWPHITVYENIEFGLKTAGLVKAERREKIEAVLKKVNMGRYAKEYPGKLSGGQQQLIAIARAIVTEPKLLLMDEPLSNIDVKLREDIRQEMKRIQQETQITTVYVTHDQEDAFLLADQVVVMNAGRVEQIGSPDEIYSTPKSLFVANFVGESNIIPVKIPGKNKIVTPWGEWACNTKGRENGNASLLFRPHHATMENRGCCDGIITNRGFVGEVYKYDISSSGEKIKLHDRERYEVGQPVRFSIEKMEVMF